MPVVDGRMPLRKAVRDGLHNGAAHIAFRKVMPRPASLSRLGVFVCGCPRSGPTKSFRSSAMIRRTLGFLEVSTARLVTSTEIAAMNVTTHRRAPALENIIQLL